MRRISMGLLVLVISVIAAVAVVWRIETKRGPSEPAVAAEARVGGIAPRRESPVSPALTSEDGQLGAPRSVSQGKSDETSSAPVAVDHIITNSQNLVRTKRFDAAIALLEEYSASHPTDDRVLEELAIVTLRLGKTDESEGWLRKTLEVNPRNSVALGELITLLEESRRNEDTLDAIQSVLTSCPDCTEARLALGNVFLKAGDADSAIPELRKAADNGSLKEVALRQLYAAFLKTGDREGAIAALAEVVGLFETQVAELKRKGAAVEVLENSLRSDRITLRSLQNQQKEG